jgi:hypothetical protein
VKPKFYFISIFLCCLALVFKGYSQCTTNVLANPSFEAPVQPAIGDNLTGSTTFNGWTIPGVGSQFNIIKTDGSVYGEGPDIAQDGNQYADIAKSDGFIQQGFILTCPSSIDFSGYYSRRDAGGSGFNGYIEIINGAGAVVSTSSIVSFTATESQEVWKQVTGTAFLPPGNYTFSFYVDNFANCDNAFLCITPNCVLPVTLSLFNGTVEKCVAVLSWKTTGEISIKQYEVQYSTDGNNYVTAGIIPAVNNSLPANYRFAHAASSSGNIFYRLKITDRDGGFTFSQQLNLKNNCLGITVQMVYPNPVKDVMKIFVSGLSAASTTNLLLYNNNGKRIAERQLQNGTNVINMGQYAAGVYFLKIPAATDNNYFTITKL